MKVLQLIDSLQAGGAERMAVNLANALSDNIEQSFLCATREEGILKESLNPEVGYLFLKRRRTIDIEAIKRLNNFVIRNQIDIVHAHSSSFFLATIVRLLNKDVKLVWHDHYGNRPNSSSFDKLVLKICSKFFSQILSVNNDLMIWAKQFFKTEKVYYQPNFVVENISEEITKLQGTDGQRIICLANLRSDKDHETLVRAFKDVVKLYPDWTLHCVGKDFKDAYSKQIKQLIKELDLNNHVYLYGSQPDVGAILKQCTIGVLSSKSEGLPLALLEYGLAGLAVVATKVGECEQVLEGGKEGVLIAPMHVEALQDAMVNLIQNTTQRQQVADAFTQKVKTQFSAERVVTNLVERYKQL